MYDPQRTEGHQRRRQRSYANLDNARNTAMTTRGYNSSDTRKCMSEAFKSRTGKNARKWQLDAAEAMILGLDGSGISGTGSGKTIAYMLPLFLPQNHDRMLIVISPLKAQ